MLQSVEAEDSLRRALPPPAMSGAGRPEAELSAATREMTRNIVATLRTPLALDDAPPLTQAPRRPDALFDSASSGGSGSGGSSGGGSAREGDEFDFATFRDWAQRKSVAKQVHRVLALHLVGPCGDCPGGRHIWPVACALFIATVGLWRAAGLRRMIAEHPEAEAVWTPMVYVVQMVTLLMGIVAAAGCRFLQDAAVPPRPAHPRGRRRARSSNILRQLLELPVSGEVERRIKIQIRHSRVVGTAFLGMMLLAGRAKMYKDMVAGAGSQWDTAVAVVSLLTTLPMLLFVIGLLLFLLIPIVVVCDDIERSTEWVGKLAEQRRRGSINWSLVMEQVQTAHENTSRLSQLLGPPIAMSFLVVFLGQLNGWLVWICPRPLAQDYVPPTDVQPVAACGMYGIATWLLLQGARITTACDGLLAQVSRLHRWEPGRGAKSESLNPATGSRLKCAAWSVRGAARRWRRWLTLRCRSVVCADSGEWRSLRISCGWRAFGATAKSLTPVKAWVTHLLAS